jgi:hypothetical protein
MIRFGIVLGKCPISFSYSAYSHGCSFLTFFYIHTIHFVTMIVFDRVNIIELVGIFSLSVFFGLPAVMIANYCLILFNGKIPFYFPIPQCFFGVIFAGIISIFFVAYCGELYSRSVKCAIQYPENNSQLRHHAIIFPHYKKYFKEITLGDSVFLLIRDFRMKNINYKVYHIWNEDNFTEMYKNENVAHLWILGHGEQGGLKSVEENLIVYSSYEGLNVKSKKSIHQPHCNSGSKKSLIEVNNPDNGIVLHLSRHIRYNLLINVRSYIINSLSTIET